MTAQDSCYYTTQPLPAFEVEEVTGVLLIHIGTGISSSLLEKKIDQ